MILWFNWPSRASRLTMEIVVLLLDSLNLSQHGGEKLVSGFGLVWADVIQFSSKGDPATCP